MCCIWGCLFHCNSLPLKIQFHSGAVCDSAFIYFHGGEGGSPVHFFSHFPLACNQKWRNCYNQLRKLVTHRMSKWKMVCIHFYEDESNWVEIMQRWGDPCLDRVPFQPAFFRGKRILPSEHSYSKYKTCTLPFHVSNAVSGTHQNCVKHMLIWFKKWSNSSAVKELT